jgi:serine/threonine protein kinase
MRAGDVANGYTLLSDFSVVGAGLSRWTFASKDGREYFLKEFLSPTYPEDDAPGSEKIKAKKRARCAVFEAQHQSMQAALAPLSAYGGNLIVTLDFFRVGAKYYKATERVDAVDLGVAGIAALPFRQRLVLLKSVAHSLKILHDLRIVHGDLKPDNVLIKRTELGYTSKLIDFDSSYVAGRPPSATEIVGTINYYSPELLSYIQEEGVTAAELGTAIVRPGLRRTRSGRPVRRGAEDRPGRARSCPGRSRRSDDAGCTLGPSDRGTSTRDTDEPPWSRRQTCPARFLWRPPRQTRGRRIAATRAACPRDATGHVDGSAQRQAHRPRTTRQQAMT